MHRRCRLIFGFAAIALFVANAAAEETKKTTWSEETLTVVVMDPLAKPLSCPCVEGYAQRDYDAFATALSKRLGCKVKVVYNDSLTAALKKDAKAGADLVIGKQSVVLHDAKKSGVKLAKLAMLTGKDGKTTQTGLVVVPSKDKAQSVADLSGHRMFFGPAESDEKHQAALDLLKKHKVTLPEKLETAAACDEGAIKILELAPQGVSGCAVISSYAQPLLEGCGQVKKGDLRVVGETAPVPFIAAFINEAIRPEDRLELADAVLKVTSDATLRIALETKNGFVVEKGGAAAVGAKTGATIEGSAATSEAATDAAKKK